MLCFKLKNQRFENQPKKRRLTSSCNRFAELERVLAPYRAPLSCATGNSILTLLSPLYFYLQNTVLLKTSRAPFPISALTPTTIFASQKDYRTSF